MSATLERLGRQAEELDFFDEITLFTEHDLSAEFTSRMGRYLTPSCRGFGYWSWKPWAIHHVLQEMEEGDRLLIWMQAAISTPTEWRASGTT